MRRREAALAVGGFVTGVVLATFRRHRAGDGSASREPARTQDHRAWGTANDDAVAARHPEIVAWDEDLQRRAAEVTPEQVEAVEQQRLDIARQQIIDRTLLDHAGGPKAEVLAALCDGMLARGLPLPPVTWLDSVAASIACGRVYVVSPVSARGDRREFEAAVRRGRQRRQP